MEVVHPRCAGIDISKKDGKVGVRIQGSGGTRTVTTVTTWGSMTNQILALREHLLAEKVTCVVMEATGDYWRPFYYLLEDDLEVMWVNARDVRTVPGRKRDVSDAAWLADLGAHGLVRASFVPPEPIRQLRDLTRARTVITRERSREIQRLEKLLEDAQIKLSVVASDIFGVSGREMMAALVAGQTNPAVLAQLARGRLRAKIGELQEAFTGFFTDHHGFLLGKMLARVDALSADIAELDAAIEEMVTPFAQPVTRLDEIPGIGAIAAAVIISEVGVDMSRFPTSGHLTSWARFAPGVKESAGKKQGRGSTGHGNRYLARVIGEAAVSAGRTDTFLGERYRRLARRRGKKKAIVAVGRSILVIVWHLLADPDARFTDLGADFYDKRIDPERRKRAHVHQLEALGYTVTIEPAA